MDRGTLVHSLATPSAFARRSIALAMFCASCTFSLLVFAISPGKTATADANYPAALQQCGECHMIFPAKMLPQRSWKALLAGLDNHFGENAAVSDAERAEILNYLVSHAADSPNTSPRDRHYISELSPDSVPLRITRTRWWNQMHADFDFDGVKRTKVKSAANCLACHPSGVN